VNRVFCFGFGKAQVTNDVALLRDGFEQRLRWGGQWHSSRQCDLRCKTPCVSLIHLDIGWRGPLQTTALAILASHGTGITNCQG